MTYMEYLATTPKIDSVVWICDYRFNNSVFAKPIRAIHPTKVKFRPASDSKKHVYYANHVFRPFNKNGTLASKCISPYDNTGYRAYTGTPLHIFINEKECIEFYNKQLMDILKQGELELASSHEFLQSIEKRLEELK